MVVRRCSSRPAKKRGPKPRLARQALRGPRKRSKKTQIGQELREPPKQIESSPLVTNGQELGEPPKTINPPQVTIGRELREPPKPIIDAPKPIIDAPIIEPAVGEQVHGLHVKPFRLSFPPSWGGDW